MTNHTNKKQFQGTVDSHYSDIEDLYESIIISMPSLHKVSIILKISKEITFFFTAFASKDAMPQ